ncbi:MAG: TonB-dependent receptor plug domain-containing protein [Pyrinomonadaceae bacterium]
MKLFTRLGFSMFVLTFCSLAAFAQVQQGEIKGNVSDSSGGAISGASVSVVNSVGVIVNQTVTRQDGIFSIGYSGSEDKVLVVRADGFAEWKEAISGSAIANYTDVSIVLAPSGIQESVTVTATRTQVADEDTSVSVSVLDREQIQRAGFNTIGDAFRNLNGVSTVNEGAFQVRPRIRGFDSNRVLVLVDGERLNNARTSTIQSGIELGLVDVDQIESLEVVRGSGSVLYGTDALGGTINIITRDAPRGIDEKFRFGASINGYYSTNENGRRGTAAVTGSNNKFAFRVSQSLNRFEDYSSGNLNGMEVDGIDADGLVLNSQSHGSATKVSTRFFFNDNNDLKFGYDRLRTGNIGVPTLVGVFNAYFPFSNRDKFSGSFESRNLSKHLGRIVFRGYIQDQKRRFDTNLNVPAALPYFPGQKDFSDTTTKTRSLGLDFQSDWLLPRNNFVTAGVSFFRDHNKDERFQDSYIPNFAIRPPGLTHLTDNSPSLPNASFSGLAAFAQDQAQISSRVRLVGGIRVERFHSKSEPTASFSFPALLTQDQIDYLGLANLANGMNAINTAVTGDLSTIVSITNNFDWTAKIGRSYRVPNLFERFYTGSGSVGGIIVGNPNLEPESGISVETGGRYRTNKIATSITYINSTFKNLLSNEPIGIINGTPVMIPDGLYQTKNIGKARIQGIEADFSVPIKLGLGYLTPNASIGWLRGDDLESNEPLTTITPLKTVLNLRWQNYLNNYWFDVTTRIVNKQSRLSPEYLVVNGGPEAGFATTELGGGYVFKREHYRVTLSAGIKNLFNRFYREQFVLAPARGRSLILSTTMELD